MNQLTPDQTSFLLLGALVAVAVVLLVVVIFIGAVTMKVIGYASRFKGFQAGRNAKSEMSFSGVVDETPLPAKPGLLAQWRKPTPKRKRQGAIAVDGQGHPIPARELVN